MSPLPEPLPTTKPELLSRIDRDWSGLMAPVNRPSAAEMITPAAGNWSPKDNLAPVTAWLEVLLRLHLGQEPLQPTVRVDKAMRPCVHFSHHDQTF